MRRSHLLVRRTRSIGKAIPASHRTLISGARAPRLSSPRKASTSSVTKTRISDAAPAPVTHLITTSDPDPPEGNDPDASPDPENLGGVVGSEAATGVVKEGVSATSQLPTGLDILWSPDAKAEENIIPSAALPPQEIMDQVLTNFHLTLHPQTQHRAAYVTASGPPQEPTLALYCPIEGGDYIIDATVRQLGHRAGADVVVIDAAQLAAGESGQFGKAASVLQLKHNPLHFVPSRGGQPYARSRQDAEDEDEEDDNYHPSTPQLTMQFLSPAFASRPDRSRASSRRGSTSMPQLKIFFNELINVAAPPLEGSEQPTRRPRIVYLRDFPTLASTSSVWYPALLAAVRERRQGPLARPTSPVLNPTTIIFGATPSITVNQVRHRPYAQDSSASNPSRSKSKKPHPENSEDEVADKAREKRLRDRLRKWEKGGSALHDEVPPLLTGADFPELSSSAPGPIMVVDAPDGLPSGLAQMLSRLGGSPGRFGSPSSNRESSPQSGRFFRTSVVVPSVRSLLREKACRMSRRRELNELAVRMAVLSVGGALNKMQISAEIESGSPLERMWADWGHSVEPWTNTRQIADIVVGQAARSLHADIQNGSIPTLDDTQVEWPRVFDAWATYKGLSDNRKAWIKESLEKAEVREDEEEEAETEKEGDEVIEQIRQEAEDGILDSYEQKLVSCIVDTRSISTTFSKVHLPPHTIDSVRTMVSLPLLHPDAFSHGILKEHNMTGCLLFGPPGTGKTLLVRALAKEAGCRMLAISPSDVMDMYVGEAEKSVRAIFTLARRLGPCVVFIDEIDALFGARSSGSFSGGDHAHRGVITEFMQEMDGLKSNKEDNIMVIGATNRPFDLDDAVLRRLPRRMLVDLPGEKEREEIFNILLRDETLDNSVDIKVLAQKTEMFSGSDLKHVCVSAALDSVKERVNVPWRQSKAEQASDVIVTPVDTSSELTQADTPAKPPRTLSWHNFEAALKEITPSSSESLGTLADLRKWNQEFGEGRKERKKQVWGKDRFGFTIEKLQKEENKVQPGFPSGSASA